MPPPRGPAPAGDRPRRRRRRPGALAVYASSGALFVGTLGFLGVRMADGQDPALGHRSAKATVTVPSSTPSPGTAEPAQGSDDGAAPAADSGTASSSGATPVQTGTS